MQLFAAEASGRWVLPWVGGWESVWAAQADRSAFGGPSQLRFDLSTTSDGVRSSVVAKSGSVPFRLISARQSSAVIVLAVVVEVVAGIVG